MNPLSRPNRSLRILAAVALGGILCQPGALLGVNYYLDADGGNDANTGLAVDQAWASLGHASGVTYQPGDRILLQRGDRFPGKLALLGQAGSGSAPIVIDTWDEGDRPIIDAAGHLAGVHVRNSRHIEIRGLEIVADGGETVDGSVPDERYGVLVNAFSGESFTDVGIFDLVIHDIYPEADTPHEGKNPTTYLGTGIGIHGVDSPVSSGVVVDGCDIRRTGYKAVEMRRVRDVQILNTYMKDIGGPALQPSRVADLVVRGNTVDGSGSYLDPRMHGRGSGIWPWSSDRVLIERNRFMHARGKYDSCGAHIDFNCNDVIIQYNLSIDNEGGFVEILGNNRNCAYRYNISINDGARIKGLEGAGQDGRTLWVSGYVGKNNPQRGPYDTYIYNNTIYVDGDHRAAFHFNSTTEGLLVANNIFHLVGPTAGLIGGSGWTDAASDRVVWTHNLFLRTTNLPPDLPLDPGELLIGDAGFAAPGGHEPDDYQPLRTYLVRDRGAVVEKLPGDPVGLEIGLAVTEDFLGAPITGLPDLGAIEAGIDPPPWPDQAAYAENPAALDSGRVGMSGLPVYTPVEYFFREVSGNLGGDDSGWQAAPTYVDRDLLPNTRYAYEVIVRDAEGREAAASEPIEVVTPIRDPFQGTDLLAEDFSRAILVGNQEAPFTAATWFTDNAAAWSRDSSTGGSVGLVHEDAEGSSPSLRLGWGFDEVVISCFPGPVWGRVGRYRLSGTWQVHSVLAQHRGFIAGFGEFDAATGRMIRRIKESVFGETSSPTSGQTGSFELEVSADEYLASLSSPDNHIGMFFHHDDDENLFSESTADTRRNDVYLVDDIKLSRLAEAADSDGDLMPDEFESQVGLQPGNPDDGDADPDLDGWTNTDEYLLGSDIASRRSMPVEVEWDAERDLWFRIPEEWMVDGRIYILEEAPQPAGNPDWTAIDAFRILGTPEGPVPSLRGKPDSVRQFYRIRVEFAN